MQTVKQVMEKNILKKSTEKREKKIAKKADLSKWILEIMERIKS